MAGSDCSGSQHPSLEAKGPTEHAAARVDCCGRDGRRLESGPVPVDACGGGGAAARVRMRPDPRGLVAVAPGHVPLGRLATHFRGVQHR